jgi:hypothetical protein
MSKLMDVCGLVDYNTITREHDRSKSIYGSLLVDEQSDYFEGFVRTYDETNSFVVFGTFNEEDGFHMYSCNEDMQEPNEMFIEASKKDNYDIRKSPRSFKFAIPGMKVMIQDGEIYRDVTYGEISVLREKIDNMKNRCNLVSNNPQKIIK